MNLYTYQLNVSSARKHYVVAKDLTQASQVAERAAKHMNVVHAVTLVADSVYVCAAPQ